MIASQKIKDLIASFEGFSAKAYQPVPGDKWTVGYGSTVVDGSAVMEGDAIDEIHAKEVLETVVDNVARQISSKQIPSNVTQNQFDAVVSLVYNIGYGNFKSSNTGKMFYGGENISDKFLLWIKSGGKIYQGLIKRRVKESKIYDGGSYDFT